MSACAPLPSFGAVTKYGAANSIALAVGDVDRDAVADVVVVTRTASAGEVLIFKGASNGALGASRPLYASTPVKATGVLIADVDADGSNDIVTWDGQSPVGIIPTNTVSVHRQNIAAAGTFLTAQSFSVPNLRGVAAGKLNADTRPDLVIRSNSPDETYPYFASTSSPGVYTKGTLIAADPIMVSHVIDIDGDGFDDVAFTRDASGLALAFNNHTVSPGTFVMAAVGAGPPTTRASATTPARARGWT